MEVCRYGDGGMYVKIKRSELRSYHVCMRIKGSQGASVGIQGGEGRRREGRTEERPDGKD